MDTAPAPPQNNKINWKKVLIGVLIGILLIGGGVAVWLLLGQPTSQSTPPTSTPTPSAQTSTPSAQVDETADWKTFNGRYYTFKYPPNWKIEKGTVQEETRLVSPDLVTNDDGPIIIVKAGTLVRLFQSKPPTDRDLDNYLHENSTETTLGGEKAAKVTEPAFTTYFVVSNNKFYQIPRLYPEGKQAEYENTFNQILSTFKFLD